MRALRVATFVTLIAVAIAFAIAIPRAISPVIAPSGISSNLSSHLNTIDLIANSSATIELDGRFQLMLLSEDLSEDLVRSQLISKVLLRAIKGFRNEADQKIFFGTLRRSPELSKLKINPGKIELKLTPDGELEVISLGRGIKFTESFTALNGSNDLLAVLNSRRELPIRFSYRSGLLTIRKTGESDRNFVLAIVRSKNGAKYSESYTLKFAKSLEQAEINEELGNVELNTEEPTSTPDPAETSPSEPTPAPSPTALDTPTELATETATEIPTQEATATEGSEPSATGTPEVMPTDIQVETSTPEPTITDSPVPSPSEAPTEIPTETATDTPDYSATAWVTETPTESATETPTSEPTATETPESTATDTPSESPTETPIDTSTSWPTESPTETPTETPTYYETETPTPTYNAPLCPNGQLDGEEECDDQSGDYGDEYCKKVKESDSYFCKSCKCQQMPCGNGALDSGEECDPNSSDYGTYYCQKIKEDNAYKCNSSCSCERDRCGNSQLDDGEECDSSNSSYSDGYCKDTYKSDYCSGCKCYKYECGNDVVEGEEQCDDGNLDDGDGCSQYCRYECDISVQDEDAEEGSEVTLTVEVDENTLDPAISSIKVETKPKASDTKNVAGTAVSWSYDPEAGTAKSSDFKWYGYASGESLCTAQSGVQEEDQGVYENEITVEFANGCSATTKALVDMSYPEVSDSASGGLTGSVKFKEYSKSTALLTCHYYIQCPDDNCLPFSAEATSSADGQYSNLIDAEESFHKAQFEGKTGGTWDSDGSYSGSDGRHLYSGYNFVKRYLNGGDYSATSVRGARYACYLAQQKALNDFKTKLSQFISDTNSWKGQQSVECWREFKAKENVGLTEEKAGFHYDCAYVVPGVCPKSPSAPTWFWDK